MFSHTHTHTHIGLSNFLLKSEQDSTKDGNKSTVYFTSSNSSRWTYIYILKISNTHSRTWAKKSTEKEMRKLRVPQASILIILMAFNPWIIKTKEEENMSLYFTLRAKLNETFLKNGHLYQFIVGTLSSKLREVKFQFKPGSEWMIPTNTTIKLWLLQSRFRRWDQTPCISFQQEHWRRIGQYR